MKLPTLYNKTNHKIQIWSISIFNNSVSTKYGYKNGKLINSIPVKFTNYKKAFQNAKTKWDNKIKKGFVQNINSIKQIILPMLSANYRKHKHYIKFPAYVQPKLDGVRCLAYIKNGNVYLITRNGNRIHNLTHIENSIKQNNLPYYLDGELFTFKLKPKDIKGLAKESDKNKLLEYHVFDMISKQPFKLRYLKLQKELKTNKFVKLVEIRNVQNDKDIIKTHKLYVKQGYEGIMIRNTNSKYHINKRSTDLQKYKSFLDSEFKIIGFKHSLDGGVVWKCVCQNNKNTFSVRPKGSTEDRINLYQNGNKYVGKLLNVKYFELGETGCPLFPVGLGFR